MKKHFLSLLLPASIILSASAMDTSREDELNIKPFSPGKCHITKDQDVKEFHKKFFRGDKPYTHLPPLILKPGFGFSEYGLPIFLQLFSRAKTPSEVPLRIIELDLSALYQKPQMTLEILKVLSHRKLFGEIERVSLPNLWNCTPEISDAINKILCFAAEKLKFFQVNGSPLVFPPLPFFYDLFGKFSKQSIFLELQELNLSNQYYVKGQPQRFLRERKFPKLSTLLLNNTHITDEELRDFRNNPNLRHLSILSALSNNFTPEMITDFLSAPGFLSGFERLALGNKKAKPLTDKVLERLDTSKISAQFPNLKKLVLDIGVCAWWVESVYKMQEIEAQCPPFKIIFIPENE